MGKRSNFERVERDFYPTPYEGVIPLLPHLENNARFHEPCAGDGALVQHLTKNGLQPSPAVFDIEPRGTVKQKGDALNVFEAMAGNTADYIITNPPWDRKILHPMIEHFSKLQKTWLLFDADWMHTKQARPYKHLCAKVVSVGRLKWIPDSKMTGKDNCAWYLFDICNGEDTKFYWRE